MAASVHYRAKHYDVDGNYVEDLAEHDAQQLSFVLNDAASYGWSLDLGSPLVNTLQPLSSVVKVWRDVVDPEHGINQVRPAAFPDFCGFIGSRVKHERTIQYTAFDPLWKVKFHFHLLKHALKDPLTCGEGLSVEGGPVYEIPATVSGMIWKCIDLVQNTFGWDVSNCGMNINGETGDDTAVWDGPPYPIAPNSWTWDQHVQYWLGILNGVDLQLVFQHVEADPTQAMFYCLHPGRGIDRTVAGPNYCSFEYGLGTLNNLEKSPDFQENFEPKSFGNFGRIIGQGPDDTVTPSADYQVDDVGDPLSVPNAGIYMYQDQRSGVFTSAQLTEFAAEDELRFSESPIAYTLSPDSTGTPYYGVNYSLGDFVEVASVDGQWTMDPTKLRVYQVQLSLDGNNRETVKLTVAKDYSGRFGAP